MIDNLRVGKTANFHSLKRSLSNAAVDDLFRQIRAAQPSASQNLFHHRRERAGGVVWSAISFLYDRVPSFMLEESTVRERVCGFVLLVEHRDHAALFKSKLDVPAGFVTRYLGRVPAERIDTAVARQDAIFQKIRLRNMSVSKHAMRNKTFEADDLQEVIGPAGASRYVPQAYAVRSGSEHFSTTPSTGRIAQRSDRVDHLTLIDYAKAVIDELVADKRTPATFIRTFARAIDLASISGIARPTIFAVNVASLAETLHESREIRFVRRNGDRFSTLNKPQSDLVLAELDTVLAVNGDGQAMDLSSSTDGVKIGMIAINRSRIALRDLQLHHGTDVEVESAAYPLGQDPNRTSLRRYLDRENAFILLFDNLSLAYIDGTLFRDDGLADGGKTFLRYLHTAPLLAQVVDEKGTFTEEHTAFDADSTFGAIQASIADGDEVLVCDDLGDEWADFIGLNNTSSPPRITFYHAKHGELSLGAGAFHVSVSQAIKNLQRMSLPAAATGRKVSRWKKPYVNGGVTTSISRLLRGDPEQLASDFERARSAPDAIRRVFIVTSSLSRAAVEQALAGIALGRTPDPYFVQLYWLLMSFFSACTEMNALGYVVCQE
ncbi:hypothetical protein QMZ05_11325 [Bradyrhizobium sp. INPA03-11B]|uniref:hypothetical protein n=1 Tax=Bradyrhizobium sp. INPA03-11B TaxID=418598 RepID=UPI0033905A7C